ncbi:hypothetical protein Desca_0699 [Desulfotomaculum nigrificans CO-1-SRB]|uniref:TIGR04086 family membrane protein n=1 Tax=Desulfotomaculum nigrificans (strain DSM 14880 / VKM B-2319 / CO-1-SRB) TaxID=868595 RepID=F6B8L2_DESCC|nr:TIGR04086 family membrane protein [Desulfotomaculum nigrificans]AEF93584.1 hypothetical protein Desca_0699 [Desulfotomaculum nigrificans CO-1-SRB]
MSKLTFVRWTKYGGSGEKMFKKGAVGAGLVRGFSVMLAVFFMLGFVVAVTSQPVYNFSTAILVTFLAAAMLGAIKAGAVAGIRGWQHGGMTGVIFGMLLALMGFALGLPICDPVLITAAMGALGIIGGIIGVNLPRSKRRLLRRNAFM